MMCRSVRVDGGRHTPPVPAVSNWNRSRWTDGIPRLGAVLASKLGATGSGIVWLADAKEFVAELRNREIGIFR